MKWKLFFIVGISITTSAFLYNLSRAVEDVTTSVVTREPVLTLRQSNYRWYENINSLTPTTALADENATTTTPAAGTTARLRMNILDEEAALAAGATFKLQYAAATSGPWTDLSATGTWAFSNNTGVADGAIIIDTVLGNSSVGESYSESNPTAVTPNAINPGERGEWDWVIKNGSADTGIGWFFRMIYSSSTALDAYTRYPAFSAAEAEEPAEPPSSPGPGSGGGGGGTGFIEPPRGRPTTTPPLAVPPPLLPPTLQRVDFSGDNRIDIIDLSIILFYYEQAGPQASRYDLNRNGVVDFPDVSILMFYWTG